MRLLSQCVGRYTHGVVELEVESKCICSGNVLVQAIYFRPKTLSTLYSEAQCT